MNNYNSIGIKMGVFVLQRLVYDQKVDRYEQTKNQPYIFPDYIHINNLQCKYSISMLLWQACLYHWKEQKELHPFLKAKQKKVPSVNERVTGRYI